MARDEKFSIISVNTDDDEIVIHAGMPRVSSNKKSQENEAAEVEIISESTDKNLTSVGGKKAPDISYATTQEDLETKAPFDKMRLVIMSAALLLVVGFIMYYFFLR